MKSRASLVLMEQLVMILVFALCAALCLGLFVRADALSRETDLQDRAVVLAQNGAETIKACRGDLDRAAVLLNGTRSGDTITVPGESMTMLITVTASDVPGLGTAEITVTGEDQTILSLTAAWQEVD